MTKKGKKKGKKKEKSLEKIAKDTEKKFNTVLQEEKKKFEGEPLENVIKYYPFDVQKVERVTKAIYTDPRDPMLRVIGPGAHSHAQLTGYTIETYLQVTSQFVPTTYLVFKGQSDVQAGDNIEAALFLGEEIKRFPVIETGEPKYRPREANEKEEAYKLNIYRKNNPKHHIASEYAVDAKSLGLEPTNPSKE